MHGTKFICAGCQKLVCMLPSNRKTNASTVYFCCKYFSFISVYYSGPDLIQPMLRLDFQKNKLNWRLTDITNV